MKEKVVMSEEERKTEALKAWTALLEKLADQIKVGYSPLIVWDVPEEFDEEFKGK